MRLLFELPLLTEPYFITISLLMTSTIVRDAMHHGTSSHGFGRVASISM